MILYNLLSSNTTPLMYRKKYKLHLTNTEHDKFLITWQCVITRQHLCIDTPQKQTHSPCFYFPTSHFKVMGSPTISDVTFTFLSLTGAALGCATTIFLDLAPPTVHGKELLII